MFLTYCLVESARTWNYYLSENDGKLLLGGKTELGIPAPVLPELARDKDLFLMARDSSSVVLTTLEEQTYSADALGSYRGSVGNAHWAFTSAALFSGLIADAQKR
jgi:hypothetical protein